MSFQGAPKDAGDEREHGRRRWISSGSAQERELDLEGAARSGDAAFAGLGPSRIQM